MRWSGGRSSHQSSHRRMLRHLVDAAYAEAADVAVAAAEATLSSSSNNRKPPSNWYIWTKLTGLFTITIATANVTTPLSIDRVPWVSVQTETIYGRREKLIVSFLRLWSLSWFVIVCAFVVDGSIFVFFFFSSLHFEYFVPRQLSSVTLFSVGIAFSRSRARALSLNCEYTYTYPIHSYSTDDAKNCVCVSCPPPS